MLLRRAVAADPSPHRRMALVEHFSAMPARPSRSASSSSCRRRCATGSTSGASKRPCSASLGSTNEQIRLYQQMAREQPEQAASVGQPRQCAQDRRPHRRGGQGAAARDQGRAGLRRDLVDPGQFQVVPLLDHGRPRDAPAAARPARAGRRAAHPFRARQGATRTAATMSESFRHYAAGNALRAATFAPDQTAMTAQVDEWIAALSRPTSSTADKAPAPAPRPDLRRRPAPLGLDAGRADPRQPSAGRGHHRTAGDEQHPRPDRAPHRQVSARRRYRRARPREFAELGEEYLDKTRPFRHDRPALISSTRCRATGSTCR